MASREVMWQGYMRVYVAQERQTFDVAICNSSRKRSEQIFFRSLFFFSFSLTNM